jgi:proline iminopeptidase
MRMGTVPERTRRRHVAPTLILCGRQDPQYAPACSEELAAGISGSQLSWFEHSGHFPFIEEPEALWPRVAAFLQAA